MSEIINIILIVAAAFPAGLYVYKKKPIRRTYHVILFGTALVEIGVIFIYLFHDTDAVFQQLLLKENYINGQFINVGYGCYLGAVIGLIAKSLMYAYNHTIKADEN